MLVEPAQQLRLPVPILFLDIVEENREIPRADGVNGFQLLQELFPVLRAMQRRIRKIQPRRHGEDESHLTRLRLANERRQLFHFRFRIRLAPFLPMIGVVLWRIDVSVHPVRLAKRQHVGALGLRPRLAVKALDHAAKGNRRGQRRPLHKNGEQYARQNVFQTHFFFPLTASIMIFWFASAASLLSWISPVTMKKSFHAAS